MPECLRHLQFEYFADLISIGSGQIVADERRMNLDRFFRQNKPAEKHKVENTGRNQCDSHGCNCEKPERLKRFIYQSRVIGVVGIPFTHQIIEKNQRA